MQMRERYAVPSVNAFLFDAIAESSINYREQAEKIAEALSYYKVRSVIELGCGTGTMLVLLAKYGFKCCGVDLNQEFLLEAEKKAQLNDVSLRLLHADITNLQPGEVFDAAISLRVPLSPPDLRRMLQSAHEYLSPRGVVVLEYMAFNESASRYWTGEFPNPITTLNIVDQEGDQVVKMTSFYLQREQISVTAVYLGSDRGLLQMWAFDYFLWPMQHEQIATILAQTGFAMRDTLLVEAETVPGADGYIVLAEKT